MNNQKGITLITLVITIVILLILTGVIMNNGMESINTSKKTAFIAELEMIQAKVNIIYEKRKESFENIDYYNSIGQDISNVEQEHLNKVLGETGKAGFKYFNSSDLKRLDLDNINQEVLINYDTREIVSLTGCEINGIKYYKLKDIPNYIGHNVNYINSNTQAPEFTVSKTKLGENEYRIKIENIVYNSNVTGGTVKYKLYSDTNWNLNGENTNFIVTKPGLYDICFTDSAGNSSIVQKWIHEENEIFREDFYEYNYNEQGTTINSCSNSILDITAITTNPMIYMYNITEFNPMEYRYIEMKYRTINNSNVKFYLIENPIDETYAITNELEKDGEWHNVLIDLWSNENVKNKEEITGWRFDFAEVQNGVSMQIDYIRVVK